MESSSCDLSRIKRPHFYTLVPISPHACKANPCPRGQDPPAVLRVHLRPSNPSSHQPSRLLAAFRLCVGFVGRCVFVLYLVFVHVFACLKLHVAPMRVFALVSCLDFADDLNCLL